ncbi:hypothetical protein BJV78DRAFT_1156149 [Lactifluus subvellereus]|nr:hypothetical protein BJV78DRAFT_1156149 [Lactifluus subvellereus]
MNEHTNKHFHNCPHEITDVLRDFELERDSNGESTRRSVIASSDRRGVPRGDNTIEDVNKAGTSPHGFFNDNERTVTVSEDFAFTLQTTTHVHAVNLTQHGEFTHLNERMPRSEAIETPGPRFTTPLGAPRPWLVISSLSESSEASHIHTNNKAPHVRPAFELATFSRQWGYSSRPQAGKKKSDTVNLLYWCSSCFAAGGYAPLGVQGKPGVVNANTHFRKRKKAAITISHLLALRFSHAYTSELKGVAPTRSHQGSYTVSLALCCSATVCEVVCPGSPTTNDMVRGITTIQKQGTHGLGDLLVMQQIIMTPYSNSSCGDATKLRPYCRVEICVCDISIRFQGGSRHHSDVGRRFSATRGGWRIDGIHKLKAYRWNTVDSMEVKTTKKAQFGASLSSYS